MGFRSSSWKRKYEDRALICPPYTTTLPLEEVTIAEMLKENGILFVQDKHGVRVDIHLSDTLFDMEVIRRASNIEIEPGVAIKVCSAEDLIIYKILSTRTSDSRDFEGVVDYQGDALDDGYIIEWLRQFETALDDSTLVNTYQRKRNIKNEK